MKVLVDLSILGILSENLFPHEQTNTCQCPPYYISSVNIGYILTVIHLNAQVLLN